MKYIFLIALLALTTQSFLGNLYIEAFEKPSISFLLDFDDNKNVLELKKWLLAQEILKKNHKAIFVNIKRKNGTYKTINLLKKKYKNKKMCEFIFAYRNDKKSILMILQ